MFTFNSSAFDQKFHSLAAAADITQEELPVAKFMFFSGLRYGLKQDASPVPRVESSLTFPQIGFYDFTKKTTQPDALTASEAQALKDSLKYEIRAVLTRMEQLKYECKFNFELADQDTEAGQFMFNELNSARNELRSLRQRNKKLQEIQRKLKKISRQGK